MPSDKTKVSGVRLNAEERDVLEFIAVHQGVPRTVAQKRAIICYYALLAVTDDAVREKLLSTTTIITAEALDGFAALIGPLVTQAPDGNVQLGELEDQTVDFDEI